MIDNQIFDMMLSTLERYSCIYNNIATAKPLQVPANQMLYGLEELMTPIIMKLIEEAKGQITRA
jgi:phosphoribulokinase